MGVGGGKAEGAVAVLPDRRCMCTVWGYLAFCWAAMVVYMSPQQPASALLNMVARSHILTHDPFLPIATTCLALNFTVPPPAKELRAGPERRLGGAAHSYKLFAATLRPTLHRTVPPPAEEPRAGPERRI